MNAGLLKICGATTTDEVDLLAAAGADLVGLWHGVPGGRAELSLDRTAELAAAARSTGVSRPMLVTFLSDPERLAEVLERTGIEWVQLHAYQSPSVVRALRESVPSGVTIVKVLHLADDGCVERRLIPAYERAGTDVFLFDRVGADGRVGSTGVRLPEAAVADLVPRLNRQFLLAGGITAGNRVDYPWLTAQPGFLGIDVDTAARDERGQFDANAVAAIAVGWGTKRAREVVG
ncbi:phosphoribosylanthranilate isomerase [Actinokineospora alba]|uniref:N-(5'-phosphoribosyl)anthranilate isomerase n=1 Tax=Actinokineospora alba TaxID=504798 RepID=A0A1H0M8E5_9PSEU|nr:N-(5'-phosphoribosyl)anthranilate isomerase [Actinokineospora alba]TDP67625.1 phosphoribosylanthranilate isomerase [Actinokineospora alba]SDI44248.1 phosphoribosylanthranilate isomerase [Actinokineospora alba]SDO76637.1 phosphoribosylanthranilate isomerase [Actinokineospora alba]